MVARTPADLRERAVAAVGGGVARPEVARAYRVSLRSLERRLARAGRGEPLADRPRAGRPPKIAPARRPRLAVQAAAHPDAALEEHRARWAAATGVAVGRSTVGREPARLGPTRKKRP